MPRKQVKIPASVQARAWAQRSACRRELEYLVSAGISRSNIARELGCSRRQLYEWERGQYCPQEPMVFFTVIYWAEHIRDTTAWLHDMRELQSGGNR